jgi:hypothetical protein
MLLGVGCASCSDHHRIECLASFPASLQVHDWFALEPDFVVWKIYKAAFLVPLLWSHEHITSGLVVKDWLDKFLKKALSIWFWLLCQVGPQDHTTLSSVSWQMVPGSVALVFMVESSILHSTIILGMRNWVTQRKLQQHKKCCPKFNSVQQYSF